MQTTNKNRETNAKDIPALRISQAFERAKQEKRSVLIPYLMSGFPSAEQSVKLVLAAAQGGADIIELGMPFSDPLADGATVQHAGQIALERGMTIKGCMEVARQVSAQTTIPLILMGYYNPVLAYGIERFCQAAHQSGICGLIIPDLPPEEAEPLRLAAQEQGISLIFLIPPTVPDARIAQAVELTSQSQGGFVYCVSLSGVTGARKELPPHLREFIQRVRIYTDPKHLPIAIGFGLSTPEHTAQIAKLADGAVVGSALIHLIDQYAEQEQEQVVRQYIQSLCQK